MSIKVVEEEKISQCQLCKQRYDTPLILPCGETVCKTCIEYELGNDYETKKPKFKCLICYDEEHEMPKNGLPINKHILKLLETEAHVIYRGESFQKIQRCMENLEEQNSKLLDIMTNKEQIIHHRYELIREKIYSTTESRIDELNKLCDKLIQEVNEKEKENLDYVRKMESKGDKLMRDLNALTFRLDKLRDECTNQILKPSAQPTESQLSETLKQANELSAEFKDHIFMLNNSFYSNGKKIEFVKSELSLSPINLGSLVSKPVRKNYIPFKSIKLSKEFKGHIGTVLSLAVLSDDTLVSGSSDKTIKMWNTCTGECIKTLTGHNERVTVLALLSNETLVSGSNDTTIKLWNTSTGECIKTLTGHTSFVQALALMSNDFLASGSGDKTIKLWNTSTGECTKTLTGHTYSVMALVLLLDGTLVSGSSDNTIKLWNTSTGECIKTIHGHTSYVLSLAHPANNILVSGSDDKTIKLWNTSTLECIKTLTGHTARVYSLAVLTNDILVSGSNDNTIKLWNTSSGECIKTLTGHTSYINALVVLLDGSIVSASDNNIKIWSSSN